MSFFKPGPRPKASGFLIRECQHIGDADSAFRARLPSALKDQLFKRYPPVPAFDLKFGTLIKLFDITKTQAPDDLDPVGDRKRHPQISNAKDTESRLPTPSACACTDVLGIVRSLTIFVSPCLTVLVEQALLSGRSCRAH